MSLLALLAGNAPLVARGGASCGAGRAGVRFGIVLAAAFAVGFATLVARPERAIVGYKG